MRYPRRPEIQGYALYHHICYDMMECNGSNRIMLLTTLIAMYSVITYPSFWYSF